MGYDDNEKLFLKCNYKNGKSDGLFTEWWENGELKSKCNYKNHVKDGEDIVCNPLPLTREF